VSALVWLRERIAEGLTISSALTLLREQRTQPARPNLATPRGLPSLANELERALLEFDASGAGSLLSEAFALHPFEAVCLEVMQTALIAIGQGWHDGRVETAQEHFATAFIRQRLVTIMAAVAPTSAARLAVAACAPGEWHELGLLLVSIFLARRGWRLIYLGANLPADSLAASLERLRPQALVLSATSDETVAALVEVAATIKKLPAPPLIGFGGQPFEADPALRDRLPGLYLGPNAATAVERLNQALAEPRR
jgi:methanogenic corrinoid protein MtbC1